MRDMQQSLVTRVCLTLKARAKGRSSIEPRISPVIALCDIEHKYSKIAMGIHSFRLQLDVSLAGTYFCSLTTNFHRPESQINCTTFCCKLIALCDIEHKYSKIAMGIYSFRLIVIKAAARCVIGSNSYLFLPILAIKT